MENNVKTYEVSTLVVSPGEDLDHILNEKEDISLSEAFLDLSKQYQAAAEYYFLLSQKMEDLVETAVDVFCEEDLIVLDGSHPVLDELANNGLLIECAELEEAAITGPDLGDHSCDGDEEYYDEEDDYPFDFSQDAFGDDL